ncbi:MAG: hypothetical protein HYR88_14310 [Verrucomicrobia bacterium]|nr:hypothetical protein [Verrucomicrobiota bacterium]MBI3870699.1 hypothetical protein [Verrucomicrobiota bacterium]
MRLRCLIPALLLTLQPRPFAHAAATPSPDKLLPASAFAVLTVPNYAQWQERFSANPMMGLWKDPSMKPFVDKFTGKFQSEVISKLEQQFGVKLSDYSSLAQGQVTLAWLSKGPDAKPGDPAPFVFLLDAGSKSDQLKKSLEDLRKKWVSAGRETRPEKIRGVEFTTLLFQDAELKKTLDTVFPRKDKDADEPPAAKKGNKSEGDKDAGKNKDKDKEEAPSPRHEWLVGQSESLLVLGNSAKDLERILALQSGGSGETLSESPNFAAWRDSILRPADYYLYGNLQEVLALLKKELANVADAGGQGRRKGNPGGSPLQWVDGFGLGAIRAFAYAGRNGPDGGYGDLKIAIPESERVGLVRMFAFESKESSPPDFVPDDVLSFSRSRADIQKAFQVLEDTLTKVIPQSASLIKMVMDSAGKEKDPSFDLRKSLFGNLGDDMMHYSRASKEKTVEALSSQPSIHLVGAKNPEQLMTAIRTVTVLLSGQGGRKEREFLGHKVLVLGMPDSTDSVSITTHGGYLVVSQDPALLEEYLRSSEKKPKALRDATGLSDDAQKVKGMSTGMFGYFNGRESARAQFEVLKKESGSVANFVASLPIASTFGWDEDAKAFKDWFDFSLVPSFDKVSKFFYRSVYAGEFTPQGFDLRLYSPKPPASAP